MPKTTCSISTAHGPPRRQMRHRLIRRQSLGTALDVWPAPRWLEGKSQPLVFSLPLGDITTALPGKPETGPILLEGPVVARSHSLLALIRGTRLVDQNIEQKHASDTQADGMEACFGPDGVCMVASLHSGPGRVLGPRHSRLAAGRNPQRRCHANPLSGDGHSKSETSTRHTLPSPSWGVGFSVAAKKKAGSRSSSYGSAETTAPVREFWPTYVSWGFAGRAVGEPHAATGYRCGPEECGAGAE